MAVNQPDYRQLQDELEKSIANADKSPADVFQGTAPPPPYAAPYAAPYATQQLQVPTPMEHPPQSPSHIVQVIQGAAPIQGPTSISIDPMRIQCPSCREYIKTKVDRKSVCKTHWCAFWLFICFCWPCCLLPYCCSSYRDAHHSCPNCGAALGTYYT